MSTSKRSVKKQTASTDAAAKEAKNNNTNNATIDEQVEQVETAQEVDTLCTINGKELHEGDTFRLSVDTTNGTALLEVNPTDSTRNPDKPNNWNAATREAYKALQRACIGVRVQFTFTDDRRATITETATITGCGMDTTNDRATFTLSTGRKVASGYCFKAIGYDTDRRNGDKVKDMLIEAQLTAADIRRGIADKEAKRDKLTRQIAALRDALSKAIETDLAAVRSILELHPTDRATLELVTATPTVDRIPTDRLEALKAVEGIPAAAAAVRALIVEAYSEEALQLSAIDPAQVANADSVAAIMAERGLKLGDIPADILS